MPTEHAQSKLAKSVKWPVLEIAVQGPQGSRIAALENVDRIEVCSALRTTGGLTPGYGTIKRCAAACGQCSLEVLIRSRGGNFVFDKDDKDVQLAEIGPALRAGASGLVVGGLDSTGKIDISFSRNLIEEAHEQATQLGKDVEVTFHRAFDMVVDRHEALETLIDLGFTRVLTSGGFPCASLGAESLSQLVQWSAGRLQIMAGGGITPQVFPQLLSCGVDALHLSAKVEIPSAGGPGGGGPNSIIEITDRTRVHEAVAALAYYRLHSKL